MLDGEYIQENYSLKAEFKFRSNRPLPLEKWNWVHLVPTKTAWLAPMPTVPSSERMTLILADSSLSLSWRRFRGWNGAVNSDSTTALTQAEVNTIYGGGSGDLVTVRTGDSVSIKRAQ